MLHAVKFYASDWDGGGCNLQDDLQVNYGMIIIPGTSRTPTNEDVGQQTSLVHSYYWRTEDGWHGSC